jgi:hypothetical protein
MLSDTYTLIISDVGVSTPSDLSVTTGKIANLAVTTAKLADGAATTAKITDLNVTTAKLAASAVTTAKIADLNVSTDKLAAGAVTTAKITDLNVTTAKIADLGVTAAKLAVDAVTETKILNNNVTLAKIATIAGGTILGNSTGSAASPSALNCTAFAFSLLDDGDASTMRSTLGLGTLATQNSLSVTTGGTGQTVYTTGDILYASSSTELSKLADVATGNALISGGITSAPLWGKIGLATHVSGTLPVANGGTGVTSSTGSGNNVLSTSPTLVTPILGTPTSGTLTNCTGLPLSTGVAGTLPVANGGTGVTSSTGSGNNVLSTSPTLVTPILGTPTSGTLTNCTGLPLAGVVGIAAGTFTWGANSTTGPTISVTNMTATSKVIIQENGTTSPVNHHYSVVSNTGNFIPYSTSGAGMSTKTYSYIAIL